MNKYKVTWKKFPKSVVNGTWKAKSINDLLIQLYEMRMIYGCMDFWNEIPKRDKVLIVKKHFENIKVIKK